ncbi:hypothetical protein [Synechococcus sp. 1G10]|uniref:hypothetical protein n=1 Tax=Synechococcus sp. 1G10 TaxID=2025605 RepID=UPI00117CDD6B|nr:hypothetical protein [Synechococcus sp. 1G10]
MGPSWFSHSMSQREQPAAERFRRQQEELLLAEHAWAPSSEVKFTAGVEAGMRHLVGRVSRVRCCA